MTESSLSKLTSNAKWYVIGIFSGAIPFILIGMGLYGVFLK